MNIFVEVLLEDCDSVYFTYIADDNNYYSGIFTIRMEHYVFSLKKGGALEETTVRILNDIGEKIFEGGTFAFLNWWYDWRRKHYD